VNLEELEGELRARQEGRRREQRVVAWIVAATALALALGLGLYGLLAG